MGENNTKKIRNYKLRALRKAHGLTQEDLANYLNMTRTAYQHLETKGKLTSDILVKLCRYFQVDITEIVSDEDLVGVLPIDPPIKTVVLLPVKRPTVPGTRLRDPEFIPRVLSEDEAELLLTYDKLTNEQKRQFIEIASTFLPKELRNEILKTLE